MTTFTDAHPLQRTSGSLHFSQTENSENPQLHVISYQLQQQLNQVQTQLHTVTILQQQQQSLTQEQLKYFLQNTMEALQI